VLRPALVVPLLVLAGLALAGCAGGPDTKAGVGEVGGDAAPLAAGDGRLCIVTVDSAIRPVPGVTVTVKLSDGTNRSVLSDEAGLACMDLPPGSYFVEVSHVYQTYRATQTAAEVEAGKQATVKVLLERVFEQEPYHETQKFEGFIQCGYSVSGVLSSLCVNDYTHFVGPYTCEDCEHLFDRRSYNFEVTNGWQTMVFEMTWKPTAQGTSDQMRLTISHFPRPASHWYCGGASADPLLVRMEVGEVCDDQQDEPDRVPPEGLPNMHLFASTSAPPGQPASATFSQGFQVFINVFYYGKPPEGWTFIGASDFPF
jgi:hypothetical protein